MGRFGLQTLLGQLWPLRISFSGLLEPTRVNSDSCCSDIIRAKYCKGETVIVGIILAIVVGNIV